MAAVDEFHRRFGNALRAARLEAGLTQIALSERSGLAMNYISELERGRKSPSLRSLVKLSKVLHKAPEELIAEAGRGRQVQ
jgi:transcriptional regulator with XRE-family HTH domain